MNGWHRERESAGAGDNEHGDCDGQRIFPARACDHPACEGRRRQRVNGGRVELGRAIGKADIAPARLFRGLHEPGDLCEQRICFRGARLHFDRATEIDRARIDGGAHADLRGAWSPR